MPRMNTLKFLCLCTMAAGFLAFAAPGAMAATIMVEGPEGAEVKIDGESYGRLPWDGPREIDEFASLVLVRLAGHHDYEFELNVQGPDDSAYVQATLLPVDRRTAAVSSLILAGLGQHYEGRPVWGWSFMAAQLAAATVALIAEDQFKNSRNDFERAQLAYDNAIAEDVFREQEALMADAWAEMEDAESLRDAALYGVAGIAILSAIEAWWSAGRLARPQIEFSSLGGERELRLGWGASF